MYAARLQTGRPKGKRDVRANNSRRPAGVSRRREAVAQAAADLKVSPRQVQRAKRIEKDGAPGIVTGRTLALAFPFQTTSNLLRGDISVC
jgi:hypothetical protein